MLKKALFQFISVMAIMLCCITANAYSDENSDVYIDVIRTGEMNTYNINVAYTMFDTGSWYAEDIKDSLRPYNSFSDAETDYRCVLYVDGIEVADIGYGTANRYFYKSGIISWNYKYTFYSGHHTVDADIYRKNRLVNSSYSNVYVCPPGQEITHGYNTFINFTYEYQLASRINRMRLDAGLDSIIWKDMLGYIAEDTLIDSLYYNYFTHDNVYDHYDDYDLDYTSYRELFISGASTVDEAIDMLMGSYEGRDIIYGEYNLFGIGAVRDDQNVMYWCIEAADY